MEYSRRKWHTDGTCFSGGSGGGGSGNYGSSAQPFGGAGGNVDYFRAGNGAGNGGNSGGLNNYPSEAYGLPKSGTGGILLVFVKGSVTIEGQGSLSADGKMGMPGHGYAPDGGTAGGGSSGGGVLLLFYGGSFVSSGAVSANGGAAQGQYFNPGHAGGNGYVKISKIDQ